MIILLYFDFLGILFSFLVHLCLLLGFSLPSGKIAVVLNIGIGIVVVARIVLTKDLRQGKDWFFNESLKNICPYWLKFATSLIIIYGIVTCIFSLGAAFSMLSVTMTIGDSAIALKKLFVSLFSLIMICYAIEFVLLYLYKILKKVELQKLKS